MDDVAVLLEHVDLLNTLDGLDVQLLEGGLELLVIGIGGAVHLLDLAAGSTLASGVWRKQQVSEEFFCSWVDAPDRGVSEGEIVRVRGDARARRGQ